MALSHPLPASSGKIRVMVADDSAIVRGLASRWLGAEADFEIVGMALNGRDAVRMATQTRPDVIVLDVEMPELDGLGAIPEILKAVPGVRILMASTLTHRNAEVTIKAMSLGAADYLPKPQTGKIGGAEDFRRDLVARVRALGGARHRITHRPAAAPPPRPVTPNAVPRPVRAGPAIIPEVVVLASSTGGPQALQAVATGLAKRLTQPLLIVQHMPPMFTTILAEHLTKAAGVPCEEAKDGMPVRGGRVYIAPGDFHMRLARKHGALTLALDQSAPVNFCRPAADPLFMSAVEACGAAVLGVVLTGMGSDGKRGCEAIVAKGGSVLVQDEATSVVWGMPGAVVNAGVPATVRPLPEIAPTLLALAQGKA
jgi:two-component system chemotaxis response regulator CheB